ncbi:MAG: hypothetical protein M1821_001026 [Bathelium mastoideum]|nr:MAG: hypothetical protein M1821_001026 [Bathelium mastoideum]
MGLKCFHRFFGLATLIPIVNAQAGNIQTVAVGENGFTFTPNTIAAPVGSVVQFQFYFFNHSVVQGDYSHPCQPLAGGKGFYSGYQVVASGVAVSLSFLECDERGILVEVQKR